MRNGGFYEISVNFQSYVSDKLHLLDYDGSYFRASHGRGR